MQRTIPRGAVLAFIAAHVTDAVAPHTIRFEEYLDHGEEWHVVALAVADEAAVRFWADLFGHHPDRLHRTHVPAGTGGRRARTLIDSMADGWWGLTTDITAVVHAPADTADVSHTHPTATLTEAA